MSDIITVTGFKAWLHDQPEGAIVGMVRQPCDCPIATYLKARGFASVSVGSHVASFRADGNWGDYIGRTLPAWAERFIQRADSECEGPISRGKAMEILNEVARQT